MKFKLALVAVAAAASFGAQAAVITLDDFTLNQVVTVSGSPSLAGAGTNFTQRSVSISAPASNAVNPNIVIGTNTVGGVVGNYLQISGGNASAYTSSVTWTFNSTVLAALANSTWAIELNQVFLDETVTVGGNLRTSAQTGTNVTLASGSGAFANPFSVTFASAINADSTWSLLKATYTCNTGFTLTDNGTCGRNTTTVPEPGTIALLGLGLLGAGALRRKVK